MGDLTVIFLTPNRVPKQWAEYHKKVLLEAIGDNPIITISREPLDWGINLLQTGYSVSNIYKQILRGAKLATTSYIAIAEDDTLYSKEHFDYRPPLNIFAYNMTRWGIFTWDSPYYFYKPRPANGTMIATRELVIKELEDLFKKYSEIPEHIIKKLWGREDKRYLEFYTYDPIVCFNHRWGVDPLEKRWRKRSTPVRALEIPFWGRADLLRANFK